MARRVLSFTGLASPGTVSVAGAQKGDKVTVMNSIGNVNAGFSPFVIADGEILQWVNSDLSGSTLYALLD